MVRTYALVFVPDPEGGFVVTCPALPGLVIHGPTLEQARIQARDAMEGFVQVLIEDGEEVPDSDAPGMASRLENLARTLRLEQPEPVIERLTVDIALAA